MNYDSRSLTPARLDRLHDALLAEPKPDLVREVFILAERERAQTRYEIWHSYVKQVVQPHPLADLMLLDPFTGRAFARPRGYPADAATLDMVYFGHELAYADRRGVTPIGRAVYDETIGCGSSEAVRARRVRLAAEVDAMAERHHALDVCAVAAGHCREAALSRALAEGRVARWMCFDPDPRSLFEISASYETHPALQTRKAGARALVRGAVEIGRVHFAYAAGLIDSLPEPVASALVRCLFEALEPGGRLLISCFAAGNPERGYLEAFADWWLTYRDPDGLLGLTAGLPEHRIEDLRVEADPSGRLLYLTVDRRG